MTGPLALRLPPRLAEQLLEQLPLLADEVLDAIAREVPAYARPLEGQFGSGVRRGVQMALGRFLSLAGEAPEAGEDRAAQGREVYSELGRGEARVGRSLDALLGAYRTGARVAWARLAQMGLDAGLPAQRPRASWRRAVFAYIDELSAASAEGFTAEQSALAGDRERRHRTLTQLLLSDAPTWQVEEAATVAGWQPPATLTAVLVPVRAGREIASRWDARALLAAEDDGAGDRAAAAARRRRAGTAGPAGAPAGRPALGRRAAAALARGPAVGRARPQGRRARLRPGGPRRRLPGRRSSWQRAARDGRADGPAARAVRRGVRAAAASGCSTRCGPGWPTRASGSRSPPRSASTRRPSATGSGCCATCWAPTSTTRSAGSSWRWCCTGVRRRGETRQAESAARRRRRRPPA